MSSYRTCLALCACVFSLLGCGHPIRELANGVKDLIPDDAKKAASEVVPATTRIALIANLYADAPLAPTWDATKPEASASFIVSGSPFTHEGQVDMRLCFAKTGAHTWHWHALATRGAAGATELGIGALEFNEDGALASVTVSSALRLPQSDGSLSAPIVLFFGTPVGRDADGFDGVTATNETSALISYEQDGGPSD
jgi:hypothetical protein